jgi:predicted MFS family arabinose efflux permease
MSNILLGIGLAAAFGSFVFFAWGDRITRRPLVQFMGLPLSFAILGLLILLVTSPRQDFAAWAFFVLVELAAGVLSVAGWDQERLRRRRDLEFKRKKDGTQSLK